MTTLAERDRTTTRTMGGVRLKPGHWANAPTHAHRRWLTDTTMELWCGPIADFEDGAKQTESLVTCVQCAQASLVALRAS